MRYCAPMAVCSRAPSDSRHRPVPRSLRLLALTGWAGTLAYFSLAAGVKVPGEFMGWDKLNHFAAYAILVLLLAWTMTAWFRGSCRLLVVAWGLAVAYGLLLESLQWLMASGRQWETGDLLANALGAFSGCVVFCLIGRRSWLANDC